MKYLILLVAILLLSGCLYESLYPLANTLNTYSYQRQQSLNNYADRVARIMQNNQPRRTIYTNCRTDYFGNTHCTTR